MESSSDARRAGARGAPPPQKQGSFHSDAVRTLASHAAVKSLRYVERLKWDTSHCSDEIIRFGDALCVEARRRGIPLIVVEGYRSGERQNDLFRRGFSKARAGRSPHNFGLAVDVVHLLRGWDLTEHEWAVIGGLGREAARKQHVKLTWGGNDGPGDNFAWDPAHWELKDWRVRAGLVPR